MHGARLNYGTRREAVLSTLTLAKKYNIHNVEDARRAMKSRKRTLDLPTLEHIVTAFGRDEEVSSEIARCRKLAATMNNES